MKFGISLVFIGILLTFCCTPNEQRAENENIFLLPEALQNTITEDTILVIPRAGCTGCIDEVAEYLLLHLDSLSGYKIIFTDIEGLKELKIRLGSFYSHSRIYLDTSNVFYNPGSLLSIYPVKLVRLHDNSFSYERFQASK